MLWMVRKPATILLPNLKHHRQHATKESTKEINGKQRTRAHLLPRSRADLRRSRRYQSDMMEHQRLRLDGTPALWRCAQERNGRMVSIAAMKGEIQWWLERRPASRTPGLRGLFPCARCFLKGKQYCYFLNYGLSRNLAFCRSHIELTWSRLGRILSTRGFWQ